MSNGSMIRLIHGDCLDVMKNIPSASIDFICADPPFGTTQNSLDIPIPLDKLWEQYKRIIKDNGCIALFADGMFLAELMMSNKKMWRYNLVWNKVLVSGFLNANRMPLRVHEEICIFYKQKPTYNPQYTEGKPLHGKGTQYKDKQPKNSNYGDFKATGDERKGSTQKYPTSILTFPKPHPSVSVHPTQKSVECIEWLIKTYTNPGETVLDSCMGSGTAGIACVNTNRKFIGIEKERKYYDIAKQRIEAHEIHVDTNNSLCNGV